MDTEAEYLNAILELPRNEAHRITADTKINADMFLLHKKEYTFIKNYVVTNAKIPSVALFEKRFPDFEVEPPDETLDVLSGELVERQQRNAIVDFVNEVDEDELRANLEHHIARAHTMVMEIAKHNKYDSDEDYSQTYKDRLDNYKDRKANLNTLIYTTGCGESDKFLDGGIFPSQFCVVAGDPGLGKTWWLINMAVKNYLRGKSLLFISMEMGKQEISERIDAMLHQVNYNRYRKGKLDPPEEARLRKSLVLQAKRKTRLIVTDCSDADNYTVSNIAGKIALYKPALVLIDAAYYLKPAQQRGSYLDTVELCKNLKQLCKSTNVPIVCTVQMDRESEKNAVQDGSALRRIYGGDAWGQTPDVVMRLTGNRNEAFRRLINIKNRSGATFNEDTLKFGFRPYPEICSTDAYMPTDEDLDEEDENEIVDLEV